MGAPKTILDNLWGCHLIQQILTTALILVWSKGQKEPRNEAGFQRLVARITQIWTRNLRILIVMCYHTILLFKTLFKTFLTWKEYKWKYCKTMMLERNICVWTTKWEKILPMRLGAHFSIATYLIVTVKWFSHIVT